MTETKCCPTCNQPLPGPHGITIDGTVVTYGGKSVRCRPIEADLLRFMLSHIGNSISYDRAWQYLYGHDPNGGAAGQTLKVQIYHLRRRLDHLGLRIVTEWGVGVKLLRPEAFEPGSIMKSKNIKRSDVLTATALR